MDAAAQLAPAPTAHSTARLEEAGLNALQTQRQLFYDGWLLRLSPGKAKRARSVNPHFGSSLPLPRKVAYCERVYAAHGLPLLFRITPFSQPAGLDAHLAAAGYARYERTLVQALELDRPPTVADAGVDLRAPALEDFVAQVGALRGSSAREKAAHLERLRDSALRTFRVSAERGGELLGVAQAALDDDVAGVFDVHTAAHARGRGIAGAMTAHLLTAAWNHGARRAYLQVSADNAPALAAYARLRFATAYEYHYRLRPGDVP
jgi:ribosomal protein S18 acetylase RimI-like enzyme